MNSTIEIEAKVLLSKEQYDQIVAYLGLEKYRKSKQINHYIDSKDHILRNNELVLRIREKDDFKLTLKAPLSEGLLEKDQLITWRDYEKYQKDNIFPSGEIKIFLQTLGFKPEELVILSSLETLRIEYNLEDATLCLDENHYNDIVDYELEMATSSMKHAEELISKMLNEVGIKDFKFNTLSKQSRSINSINK